MIKWFFLLNLFCLNVLALDAVVTVLETPMLKDRSYDAPIVQYLRKGDVIKIHPSIGNDRSFDRYAPSPEKLAEILRAEEENTYFLEDEFIPTLDRQGNKVYVISKHLYVYFDDSREFNQTTLRKDPTDYRLEEPLARNYPLRAVTGYRGQFLAGLTQPYVESYPYAGNIKTKGYTRPLDLNLTFLKQAPGNYHERLFIGGTLNFRTFENEYSFTDGHTSTESAIKVGIGPTISYDAFKGEKNRVNLSGTIIVNLIDRLNITQDHINNEADSRLYTAYSVAPRLSLQYHRKQVLEDLDFVLGTAIEVGTPTTFQAKNGGRETAWWQELGNDKFTTRTTFTLGGYVGLQSAY